MQVNPNYKKLIDKLTQGTLSKQEMQALMEYFEKFGFPEEFDTALWTQFHNKVPFKNNVNKNLQNVFDKVDKEIVEFVYKEKKKTKKSSPSLLRVAAILLLLTIFSGILFYYFSSISDSKDNSTLQSFENILPAGNRALIQLSDGNIIELDESQNGIVVLEDQILYNGDEESIISFDNESIGEYITLSTPRGGTYQLTLPDQTRVWLNAESTLKYPVKFSKNERMVHLIGEAYFDVAPIKSDKQKSVPFKVLSLGQTIEVLGTEFNISAYHDEKDIRTTLVEGSVKIMTNQGEIEEFLYLKPGEQSLVNANSISKSQVDVNDYIDWKLGLFVFRNESTYQVLQRISRWYDVQFEFENQVQNQDRFSGSISRYDNLSTILDIMKEASDLNFKIENRKIIVK